MKYAIKNAIVLDGTRDMIAQDDVIVLVNEDRIEAIVPSSYDTKGYEDLDLEGQYLMPGLINLDVHLPFSGKVSKRQMNPITKTKMATALPLTRKMTMKKCIEAAKTQLMSGVTTIRTTGGIEDFDTKIRDFVSDHTVVGPRIIAANKAISVPGAPLAGSLAYEVNSDEEVAMYVHKLAEEGVDYIKIVITGDMHEPDDEPGVLKMPASYVRTAVINAHELGLKVTAHVQGQIGLSVALDNKVDVIEHGSVLSKGMADTFKSNPSVAVCTISPTIPYAYLDESQTFASADAHHAGKVILRGMSEGAKACIAHRIPVGLGTVSGSPFVTHYDMWRELVYFTHYCHVDNNFALHTATCVNAKILGKEFSIGTIESGKCADLIVTKNNPLADLSALRDLSYVITKGQIIANPQVERNPDIDQVLDEAMKKVLAEDDFED